MSMTERTARDYTTGVPRHHHSLYLDNGNFVIQVENAIFKVHRSFPVKYSTVIRDMFDAPQSGDLEQASDNNPLVLNGDSVSGWETLLESHYNSPFLLGRQWANSRRLLTILPIAHKYCMEIMEKAIITYLDSVRDTAGYVDLLVASQIIDSKTLYDQALKALTKCSEKPDLGQAKRIGLDAYFTIMDTSTRCGFAFCRSPLGIDQQCKKCNRRQ